MLDFMERLCDEYHLDILVPQLGYKLRDKIKFKGQSVDYDEMTKFVIHNKKIYPAFIAKNMKLDGTKYTIDGTAELVVGLALTLIRICDMCSLTTSSVMEDIALECELKLEDVLKYNRDSDNWYMGSDAFVDSLRLLRCSRPLMGFSATKRLVSTLFALYKVNRKMFFEVFFQSMQMGYSCILLYAFDPGANWLKASSVSMLPEGFSPEDCVERHTTKITYSDGKNTYTLTEGGEISTVLYHLLTGYIYKTFAVVSRENLQYEGFWDIGIFPGFENWFWGAVGQDRLGRYLKTGNPQHLIDGDLCSDKATLLDSIYEFMDTDLISVGDYTVPRYIIENFACFLGGEPDVTKILEEDFPFSVNFFDTHALMDGLGILMYYTDTEAFDEEIENSLASAYGMEDKTDELLEQIDSLGAECSGVQRKLKAMTDKCTSLTEELNEAKKSYEYSLAKQQNKFDKLSAEYDKLKAQFVSFFNDDSFDNLEDETEEVAPVSQEEMIDYLKDYRVMVVGGHSSRVQELIDSGLDIIWLRGQNELNGTPPNCDFILICTQFVSHKVVYAMRKNYRDQADCIAYFNGVNYEAMLSALYTKVKTWMEG